MTSPTIDTGIFLRNITVIDHAYIDKYGYLKGGSFNLSVVLAGNPTEDEAVILDFGTAKKKIKDMIDHAITGIDHKLWLMEDSLVFYNNEVLTTPFLTLIPCENSIVNLNVPYNVAELTDYISQWISGYLQIDCVATLDEKPMLLPIENSEHIMFNYTHGLRNSTSWGCQNIAHGHTSFIQVSGPNLNSELAKHVLARIKLECTDKYFADSSILLFESRDTTIHKGVTVDVSDKLGVRYASKDRGLQTLFLHKEHLTVLKSETTIEYLVDYVKNKYLDLLKDAGVDLLYVSEGLTKGGVLKI